MKFPPVPPGLDSRLEFFLEYVRKVLFLYVKRIGSGEGDGGGGDDFGLGAFNPVADTEASLASSGAASTEDAWTTVSPAVPNGARYAKIRFSLWSDAATDVGYIQWRTDSAGVESPRMTELVNTYQKAPGDYAFDWVALTAAGTFDYKMTNTSASAQDWDITYCGYSL